MKNNKWNQKGLKIDDVALHGAFWAHKNYGVQISSKNIEVPVKQMSSRLKPWYFERVCPLCTWSASSLCRDPHYPFAHAMRVNWWRCFECCILNTKEVRSSNKFKKHWSARVTDEFSSEALILRKSLSSLYTKCVQFLPWPSLLFRTCYAGELMIPCQVSTFSGFIL